MKAALLISPGRGLPVSGGCARCLRPCTSDHRTVTGVTYGRSPAWDSLSKAFPMDNPTLLMAVDKLAIAGARAGLTAEQMIRLLNAGLTVDDLLQLITARLLSDDLANTEQTSRNNPVTPKSARLIN